MAKHISLLQHASDSYGDAHIICPTVHVGHIRLVVTQHSIELQPHSRSLRLERIDSVTIAVRSMLQQADVLGHLVPEGHLVVSQSMRHFGGCCDTLLRIHLGSARGGGSFSNLALGPIALLEQSALEKIDLLLDDIALHMQVAQVPIE